MSAEDFIAKLSQDRKTALEIHRELERLTAALVKKNLNKMFGRFDEDDVTEIVDQTFIIVYTNNARNKPLDFSDPPKSLQSYFWRIADNLCKAYRRSKYADKNHDSLSEENEGGYFRQLASTAQNQEDSLIERERNKLYSICQKKILNELEEKKPDDYRLLISYYNIQETSAQARKNLRKDLAESIGTSSQNLTLKINRIKEKLRERLQNCLTAQGLQNNS